MFQHPNSQVPHKVLSIPTPNKATSSAQFIQRKQNQETFLIAIQLIYLQANKITNYNVTDDVRDVKCHKAFYWFNSFESYTSTFYVPLMCF